MQLLSDTQTGLVSGGSLSVHINTSIPLNYLPIVAQFFEMSGDLDNVELEDINGLINALNAAGLDPSLLKIDIDISYYSNYM